MKRLTLLVLMPLVLVGCTISFTNISTEGTATDVIDTEQGANAAVSPAVNVPM